MTDKKKILALIGAAALTLSLAACQNGTAADSGETGAAAEENQAAGQENSGETDTASGDTASDDAASADTQQGGIRLRDRQIPWWLIFLTVGTRKKSLSRLPVIPERIWWKSRGPLPMRALLRKGKRN